MVFLFSIIFHLFVYFLYHYDLISYLERLARCWLARTYMDVIVTDAHACQ